MVGPITGPQTYGEGGREKENIVPSIKRLSGIIYLDFCRKGEAMVDTS